MERPQAKYYRAVQEEHRLDNRIGQGRGKRARPAHAVNAHVAADICRDLTSADIAGNGSVANKAYARAQLLGQHAELDFLIRLDLHVLTYDCYDVARAAVPARPLAVIVELHGLGYGILVLLKNPLAGGFVLERDPARVEKDREPVPRALNGNLRAVAP